jgi:uncharacterized membrane protein SpoIIM required for sporulation/uncharacterized RDD family membrane protein YckC
MSASNKKRGSALEQSVEVETPEQVVFAYTVAGVGSRAAAALIDYAICLVFFLVTFFLSAVSGVAFSRILGARTSGEWMLALVGLLLFAVVWGYYVLFEGLADGQTPGKRAMGLRVVQDGGFSISFAASAVRNLVRAIDILPGPYAVGLLSVILSKSGKRLGDYAAGTMVVQERAVQAPTASEPTAAGSAQQMAMPLTAQLSDDEYSLLERYLARRGSLDQQRRVEFDSQILNRLRDRLPPGDSSAEVLPQLYSQEKALRSRGVASRSDRGAAREQHSIVAEGAGRWNTFSRTVAEARARGMAKMGEEEVAELAAQYREISTDLARLRTASRGRETDAAFYLSRLVAQGHNLLYKQRQLVPLLIWNFLAVSVPREVRRSARYILLSALLFFGPMVAAHVAIVRNPLSAALVLPREMLNRAETALEREQRGGGFLPEAVAKQRGAYLASAITTNNVSVTFRAFALGITAGIGTALILLFNGVSIGAALGLFQNHDALHLILSFVMPHGVLELSAIVIAGGAGLLIGSAFLLPGALTRREALVVRGRRAIRLIAATTLMLVAAGLIEGFVSPRHLPLGYAIAIGAATGVLAVLYFMAGRGNEAGAPNEDFGYSDERAFSSR